MRLPDLRRSARGRSRLDFAPVIPINLAALSGSSGLSSGGGDGIAASPSASTDARLDTGFEVDFVGFRAGFVLEEGGAPRMKFDKVVARCCFERSRSRSRSRRFSRSDVDDLSIS